MWKKSCLNFTICGVFIVLLITSGLQHRRIVGLEQELNNNYTRAFYDMVGYVENIKTIMTKASVCSICPKMSNLMEEIWNKANMAQENLNMIPINQSTLNKTSKYLNQVGDFVYSLNKQNLSKKEITKEQYETLQRLQIYSEILVSSLQKMEQDINSGIVSWNKLKKEEKRLIKKENKNIKNVSYINDLEKNFQDYPTLIYDGPFSEHINKVKPKALKGKEITEKEAKKRIAQFLHLSTVENIEKIGTTKGNIETYNFKLKYNEHDIYIDVCKIGGYIYSMINTRNVEKEKITIDKAKKEALKFLNQNGYKNMKDTYYLKQDKEAIINYVSIQDNVICYPDLVKVKVALDTGEIIGFEGRGYITYHEKRNLDKEKISIEDAKKKINNNVKIITTNVALIPTELKTEVLTYEFKCKFYDNDFLVYINVETGEVENVLMIAKTQNGVLTI